MPFCRPTAALLRAGASAIAGDRAAAITDLQAALPAFERAGMALQAAAARRALGLQLGDEGKALIAEADAWLTGRGVRNPARLTAMLAPGLSASSPR
jgi:hypothetical protein